MMRKRHAAMLVSTCLALVAGPGAAGAQEPAGAQETLLLRPDRVFDGTQLHEGWAVLVRGERIAAAGAEASVERPPDARVLELPGMTLLPGLIEGHSHLFLHPYDETSWRDQVLGESLAERTTRAVVHAEASLLAGVTTMRDLGTEGAEPEPLRIRAKRESFRLALEAGVPICFGGDVGVYPHGDNVRELVLMVDYGMSPLETLRAATSGNARIFDLEGLGRIEPGRIADLMAVPGNPTLDISRLRQVELVMKGSKIVRGP